MHQKLLTEPQIIKRSKGRRFVINKKMHFQAFFLTTFIWDRIYILIWIHQTNKTKPKSFSTQNVILKIHTITLCISVIRPLEFSQHRHKFCCLSASFSSRAGRRWSSRGCRRSRGRAGPSWWSRTRCWRHSPPRLCVNIFFCFSLFTSGAHLALDKFLDF